MAKRSNNFEGSLPKRTKIDEDINDLWGEDPDVDDLDDCIMLATQVLEQENFTCTQRNNVSILPSYNAFKQNKQFMFTSTQATQNLNITSNISCNSSFNAVINNRHLNRNEDHIFKKPLGIQKNEDCETLRDKVKNLTETIEVKEGEVSILRSQLKQMKMNFELENAKKGKEKADELNLTKKKMNQFKTELEFKDLEIVNLKQKIMELSKHHIQIEKNNLTTESPIKYKKNNVTDNTKERNLEKNKVDKIEVAAHEFYPLSNIPSEFFKIGPSEESIDEKFSLTPRYIPFLHNSNSQESSQTLLYPKTVMKDKKELDIDFIFPEVSHLIRCSNHEINSKDTYPKINKIICTCYQLIQNFCDHLQNLENLTRTENISQLDTLYLEKKIKTWEINTSIFEHNKWSENEIGVKARQVLAVVAEILPHSIYLQEFLLNEQSLILSKDDDIIKELPAVKINKDSGNVDKFCFFLLLQTTTAIIGRIRKTNDCLGFLAAVTFFITKVCRSQYFTRVNEYVLKIVKEVIFSRPNSNVLCCLSSFFKEVSLHNVFVKNICKMTSMNGLKKAQKQGIVYFNKDCCMFQVFCVMYEEIILKDCVKYVESNLKILQFFLNSYNSKARWLHYQENNHCDCLAKVNKLTVRIVYESLEAFKNEKNNIDKIKTEYFSQLFKYSLKLLQTLNFKSFDLIEKCITTYSQYSAILSKVNSLDLSDTSLESLEQLNLNEDLPMIPEQNFKCSLWTYD